LTGKIGTIMGRISIGTMRLVKGLEFRAVAVTVCDEDVIPLQERIERVADEADLEDVYNTERHLLYVACTRARDHLLVTGVDPGSEFSLSIWPDARRPAHDHPVLSSMFSSHRCSKSEATPVCNQVRRNKWRRPMCRRSPGNSSHSAAVLGL
jgi:ATP-dependent exoDNAse (exonuclease V) beta subunit